jgi:antitoxin component HigA of HigAB toxin-antitoxin module
MKSDALKTAAEYAAALKETDTLMHAEHGTLEGLRLLALAKLIEEYEAVHLSISLPKSLG